MDCKPPRNANIRGGAGASDGVSESEGWRPRLTPPLSQRIHPAASPVAGQWAGDRRTTGINSPPRCRNRGRSRAGRGRRRHREHGEAARSGRVGGSSLPTTRSGRPGGPSLPTARSGGAGTDGGSAGDSVHDTRAGSARYNGGGCGRAAARPYRRGDDGKRPTTAASGPQRRRTSQRLVPTNDGGCAGDSARYNGRGYREQEQEHESRHSTGSHRRAGQEKESRETTRCRGRAGPGRRSTMRRRRERSCRRVGRQATSDCWSLAG